MKRKSILFGIILMAGIFTGAFTGCGANSGGKEVASLAMDDNSLNPGEGLNDIGDSDDDSDNQADDSDDEDASLIDIGENYYKPATMEDVVIDDETGIKYVKNQLLVSCNLGTDRDIMEAIFEEVDATVVGYIEITSDFQIEFNEDKTIYEMDEMAEYLYGYPYVQYISLNTVTETTVD